MQIFCEETIENIRRMKVLASVKPLLEALHAERFLIQRIATIFQDEATSLKYKTAKMRNKVTAYPALKAFWVKILSQSPQPLCCSLSCHRDNGLSKISRFLLFLFWLKLSPAGAAF